MSAQVAADLRAAADVLERDGWTQQDYYDDDGCKCIYGALHFVASGGERSAPDLGPGGDSGPRVSPAAKALGAFLHLDVPEVDLVEWNDDEDRTADEVIAALRAAADQAEAKQ